MQSQQLNVKITDVNDVLASRLLALRKARSVTRADLAKALGWSYGLLSKVENGVIDVTVVRLNDICRALDEDPILIQQAEYSISMAAIS